MYDVPFATIFAVEQSETLRMQQQASLNRIFRTFDDPAHRTRTCRLEPAGPGEVLAEIKR